MQNMGFNFGLPSSTGSKTCKRKFRWLLQIEEISAKGINCLPPSRSARPSISFKEMEVSHLNENVFYPSKPDWKPISLVLYDVTRGTHPICQWLREIYDITERNATWSPVADNGFLKTADLQLFDGVGNTIETWVFENIWPQVIEFGELDMGNTEIVMCELTLRYSRAYIVEDRQSQNIQL